MADLASAATGALGASSNSTDDSIAHMEAVLKKAVEDQAKITTIKVREGTNLNAEKGAQNPSV